MAGVNIATYKMLVYRNLQFAICILQFAMASSTVAQIDSPLAAREEAAFRAATERVADSVVQIRTIGGLDSLAGALSADGPTTGLVVSPDGFIVSSSFNFTQQPASIVVTLAKGEQLPAELVATDHSRMLVLLKISPESDLPVPALAPAAEIRSGQWAVAVGRTFQAGRTNIAVGIVSAVGRMFGKVIQTDAAVSMANYGGPLVDIRGRVMGVIVPMAPQGTSEVAGVEWYDSGIGFAVPLESITEQLEQMKKGKDQRSGLLGIGMAAKNPHAAPAELVAVRPDSPAGKAGLKKGDRIVEVDGQPIDTQTDLRFALGPRYGGESVRVVAKRGDERLERTITLMGELPAFRHAFLGILPIRRSEPGNDEGNKKAKDTNEDAAEGALHNGGERAVRGVVVRMVCDASPAADADIRPGDRILRINDTQLQSIDDALVAMNNVAPGDAVKLLRERDGKTDEMTLTATRIPTNVPSELPPALQDAPPDELPADAAGATSDLKLREFPHDCKVYVPASHASGTPQAALLWLQHPAGKTFAEDVIRQWQAICDRDGMLLIVPMASETGRWERTDVEYLRRLIERVISRFKVDRHRVVVYGHEDSGAMAWLLGLAGRDLVRGIAIFAEPLPRQFRVPPNEPAQRLAIFGTVPSTNNASALQIAEGLQKLVDAGYTVTSVTTAADAPGLSDSQREELACWIDSLDRF
jgi:serine protease Do